METTEKKVMHTPTPWLPNGSYGDIIGSDGVRVRVYNHRLSMTVVPDELSVANTEFIYRAVNSHYRLLEALKEARKELHLLNVDGYGNQKRNTPASLVIEQIDNAIKSAEL